MQTYEDTAAARSAARQAPERARRAFAAVTQRPLRVAFVLDNLGAIGGTELNAVRTAESLDPDRVQLQLVALKPDGPMVARYAAAGIPVHSVDLGGSLVGRQAVRAAAALARRLTAERVDVVHCHDRYSNVFGVLAARLARGPAVIASKRWWRTSPSHRVLNGLAYRMADRVLCNSEAVADSARAFERAPSDRIVVVPNFVDDDAFDLPLPFERAAGRADLGVPDDAIVIGIVARMRPVKDHASLLRAFAQVHAAHPRAWLVCLGDGPLQAELEGLARELGVADRVRFPGPRPNRPNPHALLDVSVLCSLHEGFPNTIVEAMAAGRPVVATNVGGTVDAVTEGENGLLVPPSRPDLLAAAIGRLVEDAAARERMGAAGRSRAETRYRRVVAIDALEALYTTLAAERRGA